MSDSRFSAETNIVNNVRTYLIANGYTILQLVSPGGQSSLSVTYTSPAGIKRTCFPDLLCFSNQEILVGEIKPKFSLKDKTKLLGIMNSPDATRTIRDLLSRNAGKNLGGLPLTFVLIHAEEAAPPDDILRQLIVLPSKVYFIEP